MTEESIKENVEFISKYSLEDWIKIIKSIYLDFELFPTKEKVKYVTDINNYKIKYQDGKINDIEIVLRLKEYGNETKCHLSSCFLDFEKPIGGGRWEIENRIPIYALRIMNNFKNE